MSAMNSINIKLLRPTSKVPVRATDGSAGYDLFADIEAPVGICHGRTAYIPTGVAIELPAGFAALVCARSGLGSRHGVAPINGIGVIDSDYRGEISVCLTCHHDEEYAVQPGERIGQLLIVPVQTPELKICAELGDTARGAGGFGSTGSK